MSAETMRAVVQWGAEAGQVELREVAVPQPGEGEVLLRVRAAGVCGSDVHQFHSTASWSVALPVTLGHEFTGTIAALGPGVSGWTEGDRAVSETAAYICGVCAYCRSGHYNVCPNRRGFGYGADGAMAGYVRVPTRCLHAIPDALPFETAALTEPCCVAFNALVERARIRPGDSVLVLGPGPIGLLCAAIARLHGAATVIVAGLSSDFPRLALAPRMGAGRTVDLGAEDALEVVAGVGDGYGVDVVVDASGASAAFDIAMAAVRPLGQIVKVGWGPKPLDRSLDPLVKKAVSVHGSFSHTWTTWERVIALLASGDLDAAPIVGLRAPLDGWRDGFEEMHAGRVAKSVLLP